MNIYKLITTALVIFPAITVCAATVETEKMAVGERVVAYHEITELLQSPMDNCKQFDGEIVALGRLKLNYQNGSFLAQIGKDKRVIYVDLRNFDEKNIAQMSQFIKYKKNYHAVMQSCGNAAIIDLVDIRLAQ